jgi:hypothetical protein
MADDVNDVNDVKVPESCYFECLVKISEATLE